MELEHSFARTAARFLRASLLLALCALGARAQTVIVVNTTLDQADVNVGDGVCDCDPAPGNQCSLRAALEEACHIGGFVRIVLGPNVYVLSVFGTDDLSRFGDLDVFGGLLTRLEIVGAGPASTFLDASGLAAVGGPERVLHVTTSVHPLLDVVLEDLSLRSGRQPGRGGGVLHEGGRSLELRDVDVFQCSGHDGGGIWSDRQLSLSGGSVTLNDTSLSPIADGGGIHVASGGSLSAVGAVIQGNTGSRHGGGLFVAPGGTATLLRTDVSGNLAQNGGGIRSNGHVLLEECTLSLNSLSGGGSGGGVGLNAGDLIARRTVFRGNSAASGGGINGAGLTMVELEECALLDNQALVGLGGGIAANGNAIVRKTLIARNHTAGFAGGGLYSLGQLELVNSTISSNSAPGGSGGGLYLSGVAFKQVSATTIAFNRAQTAAGVFSDAPWGVIGTLLAHNRDNNGTPSNFDGPLPPLSSGKNLDSDGTCAFPAGGCDLSGSIALPLDPRIEPLLPNGGFAETHALMPDSPALHRGACHDLAGVQLLEDQRGFPRNEACDVGAFEGSPETGSFCDATDNALVHCPCGNPGLPDTGCDNAQGTGGVRIEVTELQCPPGPVTITGSGFPPAAAPTVILIRSSSLLPAPTIFGDGLRCIGAPVVRLAATTAAGGLSQHVFVHGAGSGAFYYQAWYRNTPIGFCDPAAAFNLSNGQTVRYP